MLFIHKTISFCSGKKIIIIVLKGRFSSRNQHSSLTDGSENTRSDLSENEKNYLKRIHVKELPHLLSFSSRIPCKQVEHNPALCRETWWQRACQSACRALFDTHNWRVQLSPYKCCFWHLPWFSCFWVEAHPRTKCTLCTSTTDLCLK